MFGKDKFRMPETIEELKAMFPGMTQDLLAQGAKSVDVEGRVREAVSAETERFLGLVKAQFGEDASKGFAVAVASGMTGEQLKAYKALNPDAAAQSAEDKKKEELLAAIRAAGAQNPGAGDGSGSGTILSVEDQAKKDFATKQNIRDEFKTEGRYVSFKLAEHSGKIKILNPKA
jgi:hypothetical protein